MSELDQSKPNSGKGEPTLRELSVPRENYAAVSQKLYKESNLANPENQALLERNSAHKVLPDETRLLAQLEPTSKPKITSEQNTDKSITTAVENLGHRKYSERETAYKTLEDALKIDSSKAIVQINDALTLSLKEGKYNPRDQDIRMRLSKVLNDAAPIGNSLEFALSRGNATNDRTLLSDELKSISNFKKLNAEDGTLQNHEKGLKAWQALSTNPNLDLKSISLPIERHLKDVQNVKEIQTKISALEKSCERLMLRGTDTTGAIKELQAFTALKSLDISNYTDKDLIDAKGLKELSGVTNLSELSLMGNHLTDADMKELKKFPQLKKLNLHGTKITDAGLKELANLPNLEHLGLRDTEITGEKLSDLKGLKHLTSIDLGRTKVTDNGIKSLSQITGLTHVDLGDTHEITDAGIKELKGLTNLESLNLQDTSITGESLNELKSIKGLTNIDLKRSGINDAGVKKLTEISGLKSLNFQNTEITDGALAELKKLPQLTELNLVSTSITGAGLKDVKDMTKLEKLDLSGNINITDNALKELSKMTGLTQLYLAQTSIGDNGLKELADLTNLKDINLSYTAIEDSGLKQLMSKMTKLENLNLHSTHTSDDILKELKKFPKLTDLNLRGTAVSDAGIKDLISLTSLKTLSIGGSQISQEGIGKLTENLKNCAIGQ